VSGLDQATRIVRFGVFEVDLRTAELRKQGVRIRLPGQSFQVLEALLLRPGELVTREELKQKLWSSDSFGDFEHGLNTAVNRVREALGDSSDKPRFVETLPRRGYRFIAPVDNGESEAKTPPEPVPTPSQNGQAPADADVLTQPAPKARWISAVLALLLLISVGAWLFVRFRDPQSTDPRSAAQQDFKVVPLTTLPGQELSPSFSPDGSQVVFAWDGGNSNATNPFNLYVKVIGSENIEQLTHGPADWIVPAWSPDGSTIAFARAGGQNPGIFSVTARGGAERKLADAAFDYYPGTMSLSWSSDGQQLLYYTTGGLRVLTLKTGEVRPVYTPGCLASLPSFSPDGKWIAFMCETSQGSYLDLLPTSGGPSKHLVKADGWGSLAWSVDSRRVIFSPFLSRFSEINTNGEGLRDLAFGQDAAFEPAIAPHGERLAFAKWLDNGEIWRLDTHTGLARSVFFPASVEQMAPDISPDGKRIAFESERSGSHEVWVANLDGSDAVQLSNFRVQLTGSPRWSPDGRQIVFDSRVNDKPALYLVDPSTALPKRISTNNLPASVPSWSPDGKWIYFAEGPAGLIAPGFLYRVASEGGSPERVTETRGYNVKQSKDGRFLYFFAGTSMNAEIHALDLASGHEQALPGMPRVVYPTDWTLGSKGIYFVDWGQKPSIDFYDFGSRRVTRKIPLDKQPSMWGGLALSPDETWLAYSQANHAGSDLMLVEGFR